MGYGRSIIYTNYDEINDGNVVEVLKEAYKEHQNNRTDIVKLWEYYRGKTDILTKVKEVRENINHKICENRAYAIANFYNGYTFGEPIQYIRRENTKNTGNSDVELAEEINALNGYMAALVSIGGFDFPEPSTYNTTTFTIVDSARNVQGRVVGAVVRHDGAKIELTWEYLTSYR